MNQILANSILYNKDAGDITIESRSPDYNHLHSIFQDTGPGISDELCNNLFTPMERLSTTMFESEGHGIGLAVSKSLVELMNGKIGVDSSAEKGSSFWLELPLSKIQ